MRGINMSNNELWKKFLENMKEVISSTSFDIWFNEEDTKLHSLKNGIATITVAQEITKKHLEEYYMDSMIEAMRKASNMDVSINVILEEDVKTLEEERRKELNKIEEEKVHQSSDNANLNPSYTFESFIEGKSNKLLIKLQELLQNLLGHIIHYFYMEKVGLVKPI